ncbi:SMODS domain-containing nucleotidyltransferase [Herbaspirillum rubrisubalbicans]|uniref:Nucleotidyltransferase n=1 Tax=Herbaspirillum rubrisubalbicans TaxID=80842 RepID=A0ABX9C8T1_9BURK|nr:nucleotidyltransferase [Herbaspirillum rubrisubalbicans]RAM67144.1 nucleotidyltransferase [Herbaspirillum rubrisubalbicans]
MGIGEKFKQFLANIKIENDAQIELRYGEITAALNQEFRNSESKTANTLQVGSYGRWTAIDGISDLDMLYIVPASEWDKYHDGGQAALLKRTKDAISARYPRTEIFVDRLVVRVLYTDFHVEVQPVFEQPDKSFKYPDTYSGGKWKITKPREEISAMTEFMAQKNKNLRRLCKMARAWKNKHGVGMGGLLIDTLAHNFLRDTDYYDDKSYLYYDFMSRDFFKYLSELPRQERYAALGSGQHVRVKSYFQRPAKKAYELALKAIEAAGKENESAKWQKIYGRDFPLSAEQPKEKASLENYHGHTSTEQFVEDLYPIDIRYDLQIDCEVSQNGFRDYLLKEFLIKKLPLAKRKKLRFFIESCDVPGDYTILWKVLNRGDEAFRRKCTRGTINTGRKEIIETTDFRGDHVVECYIKKDGVIVAKNRVHVPIE